MTAPSGSLEQRLADIEAAVRSLMTANWTTRASVVNAEGATVPLAALAFGTVIADANIDTGSALLNQANDSGTGFGTGWRAVGTPLSVDVLVTSGRLRVDLSTNLVVTLATGLAAGQAASGSMGYALTGPVEAQADLGTAPVVIAGDSMRAVATTAQTTQGRADLTAGNYGTHTGLAAGWYRVAARYALTYGAAAKATAQASFAGQRIAATPY